MEKLIEFVGNNYVWFLTITIILLFALIGYIYDSKRNKSDLLKRSEEELNEESIEKIMVPEGKSLSDLISKSKNINPETKTVELTDKEILEDVEKNVNNLEQTNIEVNKENEVSNDKQ